MMTSAAPYLLRAMRLWIIDNNLKPYILVDATAPYVDLPTEFVNLEDTNQAIRIDDRGEVVSIRIDKGKTILDISNHAVRKLEITNQVITFDASFAMKPVSIYIPIRAILAVYAAENHRGMLLRHHEDDLKYPPPPRLKTGEIPNLTVVK